MLRNFGGIYIYEEVKAIFGGDCFRMSEVRGGVIIDVNTIETPFNEVWERGLFYFFYKGVKLYIHEKTDKYIIGTFAC